jgi:hypothetical protein
VYQSFALNFWTSYATFLSSYYSKVYIHDKLRNPLIFVLPLLFIFLWLHLSSDINSQHANLLSSFLLCIYFLFLFQNLKWIMWIFSIYISFLPPCWPSLNLKHKSKTCSSSFVWHLSSRNFNISFSSWNIYAGHATFFKLVYPCFHFINLSVSRL